MSGKTLKADEVYHCGKCGLCLTTCPVYRTVKDETASPRAKVHLIRYFAEHGRTPTQRMADNLLRCLMCGTCTANCPAGVGHDTLFMRMRAAVSESRGQSAEMRALGAILPKENRLRVASQAARIGTGSLAQRIIGKMRIGNIPVERFPRPNRRPFREQMADRVEPAGPVAGTVAYFTGCATNHIFENTGHAAVAVLQRMGYRVLLPAGQGCCGLPLFFHGSPEAAREGILRNIAALAVQDCDAIITDCATCGTALGHVYPKLLKEMDLPAHDAERVAEKVWDAGEFIQANFHLLEPHLAPREEKIAVTDHLPCHLKNHGRQKGSVEALLVRLPHVDYRPTPDRDACCGGGGLFFNAFPDIAKKMVDAKIANARATKSRYWLTGCPGCRVHLSGNLPGEAGMSVAHPLEVVERGLK